MTRFGMTISGGALLVERLNELVLLVSMGSDTALSLNKFAPMYGSWFALLWLVNEALPSNDGKLAEVSFVSSDF